MEKLKILQEAEVEKQKKEKKDEEEEAGKDELALLAIATVSADDEGFNSIEKTMKDTLDRNMAGVRFVNESNQLLQACAEEMATLSTVVIHVDATTMDKETLGTMLDRI